MTTHNCFSVLTILCSVASVMSDSLRLWLFATLWTVAHQVPLSMGFSREKYWRGLPFPSPGDLPDPRIESVPLMSSLWQAGSLPLVPPVWENHWRFCWVLTTFLMKSIFQIVLWFSPFDSTLGCTPLSWQVISLTMFSTHLAIWLQLSWNQSWISWYK